MPALHLAPLPLARLSPERQERLTSRAGIDGVELVSALLGRARGLAHTPISDYRVGAVIRGESGAMYLGANLEFPAIGLQGSVHAEQAAVANAWAAGERDIAELFVSAAPCGRCRQFLLELGRKDLLVVMPDAVATLGELLPASFDPSELDGAALPPLTRRLPAGAPPTSLMGFAEVAAQRSSAPYSDAYSGIALRCGDEVFVGGVIESVAHNPSFPALAAALSQLRLAGREFAQLEQACLAYSPGRIDPVGPTRALLASVSSLSLEVREIPPPAE